VSVRTRLHDAFAIRWIFPCSGADMKKALGILLVMSAAVMVAACNKPTTQAETSSAVPDGHTSRNALDWAGVYEGVVPCADCPGIEHRLTLEQSGGYQLETRYLERSPAP